MTVLKAEPLENLVTSYTKATKSMQGKKVPPAIKELAGSIANIFQGMSKTLSNISERLGILEESRNNGVNLAKSESPAASTQEKIKQLTPIISKLGEGIVQQNFSDYSGIEERVNKYSEEQKNRYEKKGMADFAPEAKETLDAFKYNYERSYGSLLLTQLGIQPQIKKIFGDDFPLNSFSSPIDIENELIREKIECIKTILEQGRTQSLNDKLMQDTQKRLTEIDLEMMTKNIKLTPQNTLPNLLVSVAIEPKYTKEQRSQMVEAVLDYAFSLKT